MSAYHDHENEVSSSHECTVASSLYIYETLGQHVASEEWCFLSFHLFD
jgi:hypothetical protein